MGTLTRGILLNWTLEGTLHILLAHINPCEAQTRNTLHAPLVLRSPSAARSWSAVACAAPPLSMSDAQGFPGAFNAKP